MALLARLFMASFLLFDGPHVSVAGEVVTVTSTSIATAFSDCTCALTVSDHLTEYKVSTTSVNVAPPFTTEPTRSAFPATSVSYPNWSTTSEPTQFSLSICPTRIKNPTYTAPFPQPTDYTWGCPPHYLCQPDKKTPDGECNFEAGPPADTYYCAPDQCVPSPPLLTPQFGKASDATGEASFFEVSPGYFNLNPYEFGLDYDIFIFPGPPGNAKRELSVRIPGKCYDPCNDAMLEAESTGKTTDLCPTAAAFITLVRACQSCVASFDLPRNSATVLPQFQQFLFYCDGLHNQTALTAIQSSTSILKATKLTSNSPKSTAILLSANGGSSLNYDSPFLNESVVRLCGTYFYGTPIFYGTEGDGNCPSNWDAPVLTDVA
ncbi:uncharacterized protein N7473_011168 [Penicillium subrubescens]|uniref:uncharacterized protein n=1 Tax=Penicillium subrubescens TaxID=1316194 RepID=UPI002545B781|nr:uncharacterized protein N7473_011168 [Penicillium subrubescens]KAJ5882734.1 hypothetical protein N7473_011168 [Penicillium subrubescens]